MDIKNFAKGLTNSLKILDNQHVYCAIVVILFLYNSLLFININDFFSNIYKFGIVRVIVLLLILYTSQKSYLISLLLAMSYILSIYFDREKVHNTENFFNNDEDSAPKGINDMINSNNALTYDSEEINQNSVMNDQNMMNSSNTIESFAAHEEEHMMHSEKKNMKHDEKKMPHGEENMMKHQNVMESMTNINEKNMMNNTLTETECLQNYKPKFDSVGNVCSPVATFNDEFNAQGLNYPIGYNVK
jgi:hypothetical protein